MFAHLSGRQNSCRFVEDQHVGTAIKQSKDLHDLAHMDGRVPRRQRPVEHDTGEFLQPSGFLKRLFTRDAPERDNRFVTEHEVLKQRELRNEHEFLMHHADAAGECIRRTRKRHRLSVDDDGTMVGAIHALQNAHERRFAGAVAADDCVHRSAFGAKVHLVIGDDVAEPPGDAMRSQTDRRLACMVCDRHETILDAWSAYFMKSG